MKPLNEMSEAERDAYELLMRHDSYSQNWRMPKDCIYLADAIRAVMEAYEAGRKTLQGNQDAE